MASEVKAPWFQITEDDHAAWVVTATLIFLIYTIFGVSAKLFIRFNILGFQPNDYALMISTVLWTIAVVCILRSCVIGLGRHQVTLTAEAWAAFNKLYYWAYVTTLAASICSRLSICFHFHIINSYGHFRRANYIIGSIILLSGLAGLLAASFQCQMPSPWLMHSRERCPGRSAIYVFNNITHILTDIWLTLLPIMLVWSRNQMTVPVKCRVVALFSTRIIVPIVTIPCLTTAHDFLHDYSDLTWSAVWPTIWMQISTGLSILTACIPSLKAVLDSWLGHVGSAPMNPPYELELDEIAGLQATVTTDVHVMSTAVGPASFRGQDRGYWTRRLSALDGLETLDERPVSLTGESVQGLTRDLRCGTAGESHAAANATHRSSHSSLAGSIA